ncbi:hypothetical protein HYH03_003976 [Edaphochlamys debaryana]|uniref:Very-long-chain (3R)-3-hydroxyacyl-CoA dehydratase n=1 Tax=Edaphochlamys debaryana TaxID=47281 RepID=A0A835Y910_9CHLO|nr:hypothetical protein HYH03_003976 [Edaphochlamys debaryana]|eukprot:KAG2498226.1 hypothetical protein HYH03_003976 [Edaphochlamys debaryana]
MRLTQAYLALYNAAQAVGWATAFGSLVYGFIQEQSNEQIYDRAAPLIGWLQFASLLETVHAALGLVPSSPLSALMQWGGRSNCLFCVVQPIRALHSDVYALVMLGCWSAAETIRYPQYAAATLGACPGWLTWMRYTMFIPLFPLGTMAEMGLMAAALPDLARRRPYSLDLPNKWNFAFHYHTFIQILLFLYPLLWWQLYSQLLRARSKKLGGASKSAKKD